MTAAQQHVATDTSLAARAEQLKPWRYAHDNGSLVIEGDPSIAAIERKFDSRAEIVAMFESVLDGRNPADLRVLDMGCLEGHYTAAIARMGFGEVVGIDISDEHLRRAEFLLGSFHNLRNYSLHHCAATDPEGIRALGKFDIVFCHGLLYHLKDPLFVFDMFESMAKPDQPLTLFLNTQFKGDFFNLVTRSPMAELQVKVIAAAAESGGKYLYSAQDQSVFERLSMRLNPAALYATLQQYGYQEVVALDSPRGDRFGYSMNLICRKAPAGAAQRAALSWLAQEKLRPVSITATRWEGRSVDGFHFDRNPLIRAGLKLDWFIRKVIHVFTVRRRIRYRAKVR
jgi:2-polyprenyl-3-methyl-5-hydroxy-6-metoxy-1,4-benzoquinol methylase